MIIHRAKKSASNKQHSSQPISCPEISANDVITELRLFKLTVLEVRLGITLEVMIYVQFPPASEKLAQE